MRLAAALIITLVVFSPGCWAQTNSTSTPARSVTEGIPVSGGWKVLPNTRLFSNCPNEPSIRGAEGCSAVIADWGGGLADTKRNLLIIWGGGHNGYYGNELYALNLNTETMERLTNPSVDRGISNDNPCPESYADGRPNSRHSYNGMQYMSKQDLYFVFGAGLSPCGSFSNAQWTFDPAGKVWERKKPEHHPIPANNGSVPLTAYDLSSGMIYEVETNTGDFWKYDVTADDWKRLTTVSGCSALDMTAAIDPSRKEYFCIGNGNFSKISLGGSHRATKLKGTGCSGLISAIGPGFDFDNSQNRMVGWAGGDTVYIYNPATDSCDTQNLPDGPPAQQRNGTYGRFRYFPTQAVFVLVNDWKQDAYVLRLAARKASQD